MSDAYNPENKIIEQIASLQAEARQLAQNRDRATDEPERNIIQKQLTEVENRIELLKTKLPS